MAQQITAGTGNRLEVSSAPVTAAPLTMACWFKCADTAGVNRLLCLKDKDAAGGLAQWRLAARGDVGGDPIDFFCGSAASGNGANSTSGYTANTWHHACGVAAAANSRAVYLDGGNSATDTNTHTPAGVDWFGLQVQLSSTSTYTASAGNVTLAEVALWDVALSAAEVLSLARGFCPLLIRPDALVFYSPLGGIYGNHYNDIVGGFHLSATGTVTKVDHATKLIYPRGIYYPPAAAATGILEPLSLVTLGA